MGIKKQRHLNFQYHDIQILYIEDEKFAREKILRVLGRRFAKIHLAIDGKEGLELYQKSRPDLIIADMKINQLSTLEMIEKIREYDENVKIILIAGNEEYEYFIQSMENQVNHFISKPIDLEHFLSTIQKSVYQIQLEKELAEQKMITRALLDLQNQLIFVIEHGQIVEFNNAFSAFTGIDKNFLYPRSKSLATYFVDDRDYFYPKDPEKWLQELLDFGESVRVKWSNAYGKTFIFDLKTAAIPNTKQVYLVGTDITELEIVRKKNELLAMMDPLTNCYNRIKFDELLENQMNISKDHERSFSLIMLDIDDFKRVNKDFGYEVGDKVLITLSIIIQQRIGECDIFARWSGAQFMILIPKMDAENGRMLAESIRTILGDYWFPKVGRVTCSFGVTEFSTHKSKSELILEAEHALYQSKKQGRNCVTVHQ